MVGKRGKKGVAAERGASPSLFVSPLPLPKEGEYRGIDS
jgi:hypothetical protein